MELSRRPDLTADCDRCFGLCCAALAFAKSADFAYDKAAGDPCENLDGHDRCRVHSTLRDRGFKGCTVFDCFGAGQQVSQGTFGGRSWREDPQTRTAMFATFPIMRRLHELLWYLDEASALVEGSHDATPWCDAFERVRRLSAQPVERLAELDVDAEYDAARDLLVRASEIARADLEPGTVSLGRRVLGPGSDLRAAALTGADLGGVTLRGSVAIAADLSRARMTRCDLLGVDLRDADLRGADLGGAIYLTQMQVSSARGDSRTVLPDGLARPSHWDDRQAAGA